MIVGSGIISIGLQFLTGIAGSFGLRLKISKDKKLFKDLLKVELGVQLIEFIFYLWMILNISKIANITPYRYYDWIITTPLMLITLMAYLDTKRYSGLKEYLNKNFKKLVPVLLANLGMMLLGLLGEINIMNYNSAIIIGWIPFIYYFKYIYDEQIKDNKETTKDRKALYWFFLIFWSLYGVAAFLPYLQKNILYNLLDLFSKNLLGLILVYVLWKK